MRNKVKLYIGGSRADLDNGAFLLLNYTAEDLSNPTIIKNSFSRQIALKGTPANNKIFGEIYRNDRQTQYGGGQVGVDFDPTRKTDFVIYNEANEILESGYVKLDKITTTRKGIEYTVTLYGGLGSFLYGLSYDGSGNKLTLADLDFGETLDFTIDRDAVSDAWARLDGDTSKAAKWDIINFIPAYCGLPQSPFDANKALVKTGAVGLPAKDGDYAASDGWSIVTLSEKVTGNEAKDFRSYLQKPCIKMSALIDAICNPANNGGWTVNQDQSFFDPTNPYWADTWLTLPMLNDLNIDVAVTYYEDNFNGGTYTIPGGGNLSVLYNIWLDFAMVGTGTSEDCKLDCEDDWAAGMAVNDNPGMYLNYIEWEVIAYDSNDVVITQFYYRVSTKQAPEGYVQMDDVVDYISGGFTFIKNGQTWKPNITVQEYGVAKVKVTQTMKSLSWGNLRAAGNPNLAWPLWSYDFQDGEYFDCYAELQGSYIKCELISSSTVRTGATITKAALLGGGHTPAEYLLSYCKMFGLQMVCHKDSKTIDLIQRSNLYTSTMVNINGRIDRGKPMEKVPFAFDARWYLFGNEAKGEFAEYYESRYNQPYGQYRVNTGYEFDADERCMTDSIIFGNLCELIETSKYYCDLSLDGTIIPSVFLGGGKFTLYKGGETKDFDLPYPLAASRTWLNASYPMHDDWSKIQLHGAENAHLDERDTLVFFQEMKAPNSSHITLSDDIRAMLSLNGNNPCWMPHYCDYDASWQLTKMPRFTRNIWSGLAISYQMDFGDPLEIQVPGATIGANSNVFERYWDKYISDRYDDDSAVVTCWVDLRGLQVNENMLRDFYYFDGAVWALNRIINHSLTTSGPTQCEFVKVQDTTNYTTN